MLDHVVRAPGEARAELADPSREVDMDATILGRADLSAWALAQPDDLYAVDRPFQALVRHHGLAHRAPAFHRAGRAVAGPVDAAAREENLHANLPVLDDWDGIGRPTARLRHHPRWADAGRHVYGTGIMAAYGEVPVPHRFILGLFYLTAQAGEAGHNCPLACDAGAIRALQLLGTPAQREQFLPRLLDPDFDTNFTAAQFLTEVQGGSDVGANACLAVPVEPGAVGPGSPWRISGEKWFCSNADADLFVITARVGGAGQADLDGTRGLGLFLVPRLRADGSPNGFRIRRVKDKIGTRTLVTAEVDFDGAEAQALGPPSRGFKHVMELVVDTSRLYNAFGCAGHARRAWVVASTFARHRRAFGTAIADFAQVRETLGWMRADAVGCLASSMWLAGMQERIDQGLASDSERAFFRLALNLNKTWTAALSHDAVNRGIEILGGNGTIETFSVLPRLLRDNVVFENWEGTHNVLRAQALRDIRRYRVHEGFFDILLAHATDRWQSAIRADQAELAAILTESDEALSNLRFRRLAGRLATWVMLVAMVQVDEITDEMLLFARHLAPPALDAEYLRILDRLLV